MLKTTIQGSIKTTSTDQIGTRGVELLFSFNSGLLSKVKTSLKWTLSAQSKG